MKVFVAGATGALGRALVPQLVARGREVVGMTRSASKQEGLRALGARPVVADALDPDAVAQAVASAEPEVIVKPGVCPQLGGAPGSRPGQKRFDRQVGLSRQGRDRGGPALEATRVGAVGAVWETA
jgi:nucleoside-diphosphate-sugar epimerase